MLVGILERLAAAAAALRRQNDPDHHDVAAGLEAFVAGEFESLDEAFGLRRRPGQRANTTLARLQRRNAGIVAAAERYDGLPEEIGRALYRALTAYFVAGYRIDCRTGQPPANRRHLYDVLEHCDDAIPGASMLGKIIRTAE